MNRARLADGHGSRGATRQARGTLMASQSCLARLPQGGRCAAPALALLGYCPAHAARRTVDRRLLANALQHAVAAPQSYLAALMAHLSDEDLATALGADPHHLWLLRLSAHPRMDHWAEDVTSLAVTLWFDAARLDALLRRLGMDDGASRSLPGNGRGGPTALS
jgi:hypothetical protein